MIFLIGWVLTIILTIFKILPLGILFVWGIYNFLYHFISMFQRNTKLTNFGVGCLVIGLLVAIGTGLKLFVNYNIVNILIK